MSTRTTAQSEGLSSGGAAIGILLSWHLRSGRAGLRYCFDPGRAHATSKQPNRISIGVVPAHGTNRPDARRVEINTADYKKVGTTHDDREETSSASLSQPLVRKGVVAVNVAAQPAYHRSRPEQKGSMRPAEAAP